MREIDKQRINKAKLWDYLILVARIWLAWTLIRYGYSKLIDGQFRVTEATMNLVLIEVDYHHGPDLFIVAAFKNRFAACVKNLNSSFLL